jgi:hypothetical protein
MTKNTAGASAQRRCAAASCLRRTAVLVAATNSLARADWRGTWWIWDLPIGGTHKCGILVRTTETPSSSSRRHARCNTQQRSGLRGASGVAHGTGRCASDCLHRSPTRASACPTRRRAARPAAQWGKHGGGRLVVVVARTARAQPATHRSEGAPARLLGHAERERA